MTQRCHWRAKKPENFGPQPRAIKKLVRLQKITHSMRFLHRNWFLRLLTGAIPANGPLTGGIPAAFLLIGTILTAAFLTGCNHTDSSAALQAAMKDSAQYTSIQWLDSTKIFGKITEGQKLQVSFRFKNTGATPLVIARVQPSCGCTVAEQPKEPIAPGGEGKITAIFNSEGHPGLNQKTLHVTANTKGSQGYYLKFAVIVDKKAS